VNGTIDGQDQQQGEGHDAGEHARKHARAADLVGQQPPIGRISVARTTKPAVRKPASRGQAELVAEQRGQVDGEGDEAAEREEVERR
jgi:hypothetical protein